MPFHFPFMPYGYNYNYRRPVSHIQNMVTSANTNIVSNVKEKDKEKYSENKDSEYFFELFGMKLYFDDVLIICILIFLYNEQVRDQELFLCLVLLLIS